MNTAVDYFMTADIRRQRIIEAQEEYEEDVKAIASEKWKASWSMAGVYCVQLGSEYTFKRDFSVDPRYKAQAKVIEAAPKMLAYIMEAAKSDDDAEALLNEILEGK